MKTLVKLLLGLILMITGPEVVRSQGTVAASADQAVAVSEEEEHPDWLHEMGISPEMLNTILVVVGIGGMFGLVALAWKLSDKKHPSQPGKAR